MLTCASPCLHTYTPTWTVAPGLGPTQVGVLEPWLKKRSLMYVHIHMYSYSILNILLAEWQTQTPSPTHAHVCTHMQQPPRPGTAPLAPPQGSQSSSLVCWELPAQMSSQETLTSAYGPAQWPGQSSEASSQSRGEGPVGADAIMSHAWAWLLLRGSESGCANSHLSPGPKKPSS